MMTMRICSVDRGEQLENWRKNQTLTDITLHVEDASIPAHKLILSLHSQYFRTMFNSVGFLESSKSTVEIKDMEKNILEAVITYFYTGDLIIKDFCKERAFDLIGSLLEVESLLQLDDMKLRTSLENRLLDCLDITEATLEDVFQAWNLSVLYNLDNVALRIDRIFELKLEEFLKDPEQHNFFSFLGIEEITRLLNLPHMCISSESVLLQLCLVWANSNLQLPNELDQLRRVCSQFNLRSMEKKHLSAQVVSALSLRLSDPEIKSLALPPPGEPANSLTHRSCPAYFYLTESKYSKNQTRNIEDFVDPAAKSIFFCLDLGANRRERKLTAMTSFSSLIGTHNGNYFQPVNEGSAMFLVDRQLVIFGSKSSQHEKKMRNMTIFSYDFKSKVWEPPVTDENLPTHVNKKTTMVAVLPYLKKFVVIYKENEENSGFIYLLQKQSKNVEQLFISDLPSTWVNGDFNSFSSCMVESGLFLCSRNKFVRFDITLRETIQLMSPIGDIGPNKPLLAAGHQIVYLVTGKPEDNGKHTNSLQAFDTLTKTWQHICYFEMRFTPTFMAVHSGKIHIAGRNSQKKNFFLAVCAETGNTEIMYDRLDGVWSPGIILHAEDIPDFQLDG